MSLRDVFRLQMWIALGTLAFVGVQTLRMPDVVPIHWGIDGKPDAFGSRWVQFGFNAFMAFIPPVMTLLIGPRLRDRTGIPGTMLLLSAFFALIAGSIATASLRNLEPGNGLVCLIALFLAAIAFSSRNVAPNPYVGIRTKWTLGSPVVWREAHRRFALAMAAFAGAILVLAGFGAPLWALIALLGASVVWPIYDSYQISETHGKDKA